MSLAVAAGEWPQAVRKLVELGGRDNVQRATALTVEVIASPKAKVGGWGWGGCKDSSRQDSNLHRFRSVQSCQKQEFPYSQ